VQDYRISGVGVQDHSITDISETSQPSRAVPVDLPSRVPRQRDGRGRSFWGRHMFRDN